MNKITWYRGGTKKWFEFYKSKYFFHNKHYIYFIKPKCRIFFGNWYKVPGPGIYLGNVARILDICIAGLQWKDKYDTPRFERPPALKITFFRYFSISVIWNVQEDWDNHLLMDDYWEQLVWTYYYCDNDLKKAIETWPWSRDGVSSWDNRWLKEKYRDNNYKQIINEENEEF